MSFLQNAYTRTLWCSVCCKFTLHEVVHLGSDESRHVTLFTRYCEHILKNAKPLDAVASTVEEATPLEWDNILQDHIPFNEINTN